MPFQDRRQQGCCRRAYKDVFTACLEKTCRATSVLIGNSGGLWASSASSIPLPHTLHYTQDRSGQAQNSRNDPTAAHPPAVQPPGNL